jgi:plasmid replication initiation protein
MAKNKKRKTANTDVATQSNKLIEATYRMSVPAKRVMLMLLGQIHPAQHDISQKICINAADYADKTGIDFSQSYKDIKKGCDELMNVIITTKDRKARTTEKCVVVDWMYYHEDEGWLEATFTRWLRPHIQHLQNIGYTSIAIDETLKFSRFYTIRLYELMMQFQKTEERYITVKDLRKIFQIAPKSYLGFKDLRVKVIEPSIKEIEEKTRWRVDWEPVKTGRKITSVMFVFSKETQLELDFGY